MELSLVIRTAYFNALDGVISAPVYDAYAIPEGVKYPYVLLSVQTEVQREVLDGKVYDATLLVDIVTGSQDPIGMADAEAIADEVESIVNPDNDDDLDVTAYGYSIGDTNREQGFSDATRNGIFYVYRKLLRYRHIVYKI